MTRFLLRRAALAALLLLALPAAAGSVVLPANTTAVISGTPDLLAPLPWPAATSSTTGHALDANGDELAFSSTSDGLLAGDDDTVENVYVKDLSPAGGVRLASVAPDGQPSHVDCHDAVLSADGTAVAFVCDGPLDPAAPPATQEVYERDLVHGVTRLVSREPGGAAGNSGRSFAPAIDGDGTAIAFASRAGNLPGGSGGQLRVLRWSIDGQGVTQLQVMSVTTGANPQPAGADAGSPSISDDGERIAFDTPARLDPASDTDGFASDVYVRDLRANPPQTVLASVPAPGGNGLSDDARGAVISGDGSAVAFTTTGPLVPGDTDTNADVYLRTLGANGAGTTTAETIVGATNANLDATAVSIDEDGGVVAFRSNASNLGLPAQSSAPVWVNDHGTIEAVNRADGPDGALLNGASLVALSGNGARVAMAVESRTRVVLRDLAAPNATRTVSVPPPGVPFDDQGGGSGGSVSADGRYVAFETTWPGFGVPAGSGGIVVRDLDTGALTLASRADGPQGASLAGPGDEFEGTPQISADGRRVAFVILYADNRPNQVYVRDLAAGRTFLASVALDGDPGDNFSDAPSISDDGRRVAFESNATDLAIDDADVSADVYMRDLDAGTTTLVDRADGTNAKADSAAFGAAISGDGRRVAFTSASRLTAADTHGLANVYVRDVDGGTTQLASAGAGGAVGDADSGTASIDRDGGRVGFVSSATTFGVPAPPAPRLYVRDLAAGTLAVAGRADGRDGAPVDDVSDARLSADGDHVAFAAAPSATVAPGAPADGSPRVYERDLSRGVTRLISRGPGPDGAALGAGAGVVDLGGVTPDGGCVTFTARGTLFPPPASDDAANVYLRTVAFNCGRPVPAPPLPGPGTAKPAVLVHLSVRPSRFFVAIGRRGGTRIAFRLDKASSVTLSFDRLLAGRLKGRRCLTTVHKGRRCTLVKRTGRLTLAHARAGASTVKFSGKLGRRALAPGSYRLTATPSHGAPSSVRFTVVKAPKPKPRRKVAR
jgi:Tol biopolymer transport system component